MSDQVDPDAAERLARLRSGDWPEPPAGTPAHDRWEVWRAQQVTKQAAADQEARSAVARCRNRIAEAKVAARLAGRTLERAS